MVRTAVVFALVLVAFVVGAWPILEKIVQRWWEFDEAYSHGLMIFAISIYLIYQSCRAKPPQVVFSPFWLLPLCLVLVIYIVAALLYIEAVQQVLLVPLLLLAVATLSGFAAMWRLLLPVGVLVFALPFWDYAAYPLQLITTKVNEILLGLWGIEFQIEGVLVFLPGVGAFEIAHGCSGLRYLLVAMSLATVYSEMNYRLWRNRILLLCAGIGLALLANWIRVFVIIYMGYVTDMESSLIRDHEFFGWVLFAVSLIPLFFLAGRLERDSAGPFGTASPDRALCNLAQKGKVVTATAVVALLLLSPLYVYMARQSDTVVERFSLSLEGTDAWSPLFQRMPNLWEPDYTAADHHNRKAWFKTSSSQTQQMPSAYSAAHVLTYETQSPGKELISDRNRIVDTELWQPQDSFKVEVNGETLSGLHLKDRQTGGSAVVVYGFYVSGFWADEPFGAKLLQLYGALNDRQDASLIAVSITCDGCDLETQAQTWAEQVMPQAQRALDERYAEVGS